mmetsp:Transcript_4499/g.17079  ORF Transcript_4499/g.17079 Transcript_4499/m.17079 type:complete len:459 (-) Transcript_4499:8-1384(-)
MDPPEVRLCCSYCGRAAERLLRCSKCQQASYCGAACQRSAWAAHKQSCQRPSAPQARTRPDGTAARPESPAVSSASTAYSKKVAVQYTRLSLPPALAVGSEPRLVGTLSSHIGDRQRLARLDQCLRSIEQQTEHLAGFFAVWSAPEPLVPAVRELFERLERVLPRTVVRSLQQTRRTSQFYDLRWLHDELLSREPAGTWLLFTDDDDLWGPERVRSYRNVVKSHAHSVGVTAVCATHKVRPSNRGNVAQTVEEVFQHLQSGDAKHCGGVHIEEEFFDFACPLESLGAFFRLCNEETLLHPFADLRFTRFLSEYFEGGRVMYFPTDNADSWVYYYSTAYRTPEDQGAFEQFEAQDQASTVVRRRPEDVEEARRALSELAAGAGAPDSPSAEELEEVVELVSGLRQNIDGVLIRHFPEEPMQLSEMKRIAVGQCQGHTMALRLAERVARQSCARFGITLV